MGKRENKSNEFGIVGEGIEDSIRGKKSFLLL